MIEDRYSAKYICDTTLKSVDGNYINDNIAIFYTKDAHPEGSNWLAVSMHPYDPSKVVFRDGIGAVEPLNKIVGILNKSTNKIIYSRFRHDYVNLDGCVIDGGRDYCKRNGVGTYVELTITPEGLVYNDDV